MATERCVCGHNREAHPLYRGICSCGITRLSNGQDAPNGNCMGWTPTIERVNPKDKMSEEVPDGRRLGLEGRAPATTAAPTEYPEGRWAPSFWFVDPPPNLAQAIQAATDALRDQDPTIGLAEPWAKVADLEVHTAEQHKALVAIAAHFADEVAFPGSPLGKVRDALAVQPPQHQRQLLGYQTSDGRLYRPEDITLVYALDQGEAQGGEP